MATSRQAEASSRWRAPIMALVLVALFVLEGTTSNALFTGSWNTSLAILNMGLISAIMALGLNMQWGYAGLFNSGVVGFLAIGGLAPVLISVAPVGGAWGAGGPRVILAIIVGLGTLALAAVTWKRAGRKLRVPAILTVLIIVLHVPGANASNVMIVLHGRKRKGEQGRSSSRVWHTYDFPHSHENSDANMLKNAVPNTTAQEQIMTFFGYKEYLA